MYVGIRVKANVFFWIGYNYMTFQPIDFESTTQCKREPESDEECSRSNSVHKQKRITSAAAIVGSVSNGGLLNKRKRRKRKKAPISVSPVSDISPAPKVVEEFEDPLPHRRKDLLRGGSSGVQLNHDCPTLEPRITHPAMELYTKKSKSCVPSTTHSKTTYTELECDFVAAAAAATAAGKEQEEKSNDKESRNFEPTNDLSSTCGATVKKQLRGRSRRVRQMRGHRTQSLPWSRLPQNARQRLCVRDLMQWVSSRAQFYYALLVSCSWCPVVGVL